MKVRDSEAFSVDGGAVRTRAGVREAGAGAGDAVTADADRLGGGREGQSEAIPVDGWDAEGPGRASRADTPRWANGVRGGAVRRSRPTAQSVAKQFEREQMAYWWARKRAEYHHGAVARRGDSGGSSGSGAWVGRGPDASGRLALLEEGWTGGVHGQLVHHSTGVRQAWWGDSVADGGTMGGLVLDLEAGRAAAAEDEAAIRAKARLARRRR